MADKVNQLELNKRNANAYYRMAHDGDPEGVVARFVGNEYTLQHPLVADGPQSFIDYFIRMQAEYPDKKIDFDRSITQDNLVALLTHQIWQGNDEYVTMGFSRFDVSRKIVEHWDSILQIPRESANDNTIFWESTWPLFS